MIQGTLPTIPEVTEPEDDNSPTPGTTTQQPTSQETNWPDTIPVQITRISSLTAQPEEQGHNRHQARYYTENFKIPELEENSEGEQFADFDSFRAHHNTYRTSEHIQEYHSCLQDLDDDQYYTEIDRADFSQSTLAAQDYWPANQQAASQRSTEELKIIFGRSRGQARPQELHGHRPFDPRTRSLQSRLQCKIKKNQCICRAYARPPASQSTAPHFPSSLDGIRNRKGLKRPCLLELVNQTPPSKSDMAQIWREMPQPIRGFPAIEPITF